MFPRCSSPVMLSIVLNEIPHIKPAGRGCIVQLQPLSDSLVTPTPRLMLHHYQADQVRLLRALSGFVNILSLVTSCHGSQG